MTNLGPSKHRLTSRYQLMLGHQLIKLIRFTRLARCPPSGPLVLIRSSITRVIGVTRQS
jgi:hypothetical protein